MNIHWYLLIIALLSPTGLYAQAPEAHPGEAPYMQYCASCHDKGVYKTPSRMFLGMIGPENVLNAMNGGTMEEYSTKIEPEQRRAIAEYEFEGDYRGVYPIKVNQQAHIVEQLLACGRDTHLGLEVGSRPEMLAAIAMVDDPESLIICNGYKDEAYIETAMLAQHLGRQVVLVADRFQELSLIIRVASRHGIRPIIGMRAMTS